MINLLANKLPSVTDGKNIIWKNVDNSLYNKFNQSNLSNINTVKKELIFPEVSVAIKEERSELVKHHLWVLWTDYFKPNHFESYPQLHSLFNEATKLAGAGGSKGSNDVAVADKLIGKIDEIAEIFWATKK